VLFLGVYACVCVCEIQVKLRNSEEEEEGLQGAALTTCANIGTSGGRIAPLMRQESYCSRAKDETDLFFDHGKASDHSMFVSSHGAALRVILYP
jgi:hypothetical protein